MRLSLSGSVECIGRNSDSRAQSDYAVQSAAYCFAQMPQPVYLVSCSWVFASVDAAVKHSV